METTKLNETKTVTTMNSNDTAILTLEDGSVARIKKADLAEALREVMGTVTSEKKGLFDTTQYNNLCIYRSSKISNSNCNDILVSGFYLNATGNGTGNSNWPGRYGILLVFNANSGGLQLHADVLTKKLSYRIRWSDKWQDWITL